ncbi:TonB-dependent receptor [Zavarzinia sp.]|uniref:TonB-dependent receptor n=1 Tax=Zavarzinia sp. TaxID=2027920 RepID=UPI0035694017
MKKVEFVPAPRRVSHLALLSALALGPAAGVAQAGDGGMTVTHDGDWATASSGQTEETLPTVTVTGEREPANAHRASTGVDRLPQEIQDTPQAVKVIGQETIQEQGVTSLDQALRNVPGITVSVGEGGGGMNGDQFRIRGFEAQNDLYIDGLRDFGVYTRDTFNTESVEVFLGPSGESFGRGNFAGVINSTTKVPVLDDFITLQGSLGLGPMARITGDANYQLSDTSAVRLNVMYTDQTPVGRDDGPESKRWGVAPSIGFGLGTDTSMTIAYLHQTDNRVPDYGIPTLATGYDFGASTAFPVSAPAPVSRDNWYGSTADRDDTTADVVTARITHRPANWLRLNNDTRVGFYSRDFLTTIASCGTANGCLQNLYDGNPATVPVITFGGGNPFYQQDNWGAQNITTATADFDLGGFRNQAVAGLDASYESTDRTNYTGLVRPTDISLLDPTPYDMSTSSVRRSQQIQTDSTDFGAFASEQFWLTDELSVLGGLRWDRYHITSDTAASLTTTPTYTTTKVDETLFSPKASVIFEPSDAQTYYLSWARSSQPATGSTGAANAVTPVSATQTDLEPTESETFEVGGKLNFFSDRLGVGLSVFQVERDNSKEVDSSGTIVASGQSIRNRGAELSLTGKITDAWTVQAAYTYIDSEYTDFGNTSSTVIASGPLAGQVTSTVTNAAMKGRQVNNVPENAVSLWSTYAVTDKITLGAGLKYQDEMYAAQGLNTTTGLITYTEVPYYLSVDALVAYRVNEGVTVQVNGYNLFDRRDNFDQTFSGRTVPAAGRTVIVSTTASF